MTPTQRSLAELKKRGYLPAVTERWNSFARIRQDLYGFIDIVGIKAGETGVLAIQCTTSAHVAERIAKIEAIPAARIWVAAGNRIEVWGWSKRGERGKRKLWDLRVVVVSFSELSPLAVPSDHSLLAGSR